MEVMLRTVLVKNYSKIFGNAPPAKPYNKWSFGDIIRAIRFFIAVYCRFFLGRTQTRMNTPDKYFANKPKQKRSQARLEKILDTVESISTEAPTKKIDIKTIAKRSFVSVGAIYHHFPSVNSIFASLLLRKIQFRIHYLGILIDSLGPEVTLEQFFDILIDKAFYEWGQKPIAGKSEALKFFYQNANKPEFLYTYTQSLYPHLNSFIQRNKTDTFRQITEDEWPFLNRVALTTILSPFFEQSPLAGSDTHRAIAKNIAVRVCSK